MKFTLTNNEPFQIDGSINGDFKSVNILDLHTSEIINDSSYVSVADIAELQQALANYCPIIEDTRESQVAAITGVAPFSSLVDGQRILLHLNFSPINNATLKLTLSNNLETNDIPMYCSYTTYISTSWAALNHVPAGCYIELVYSSSLDRWVMVGQRDTNSGYATINQNEIDAGTSTSARVVTPKLLRDNFYLKSESDDKFAGKPFKVTITSTEQNGETTYSADKTYAEIYAAYQAGRDIVAIYDGAEIDLNEYLNGGFIFTLHYAAVIVEVFISEDGVGVNTLNLVEENNVATINSQQLTRGGNISLVTPEYLAQNYIRKPDVIYQYESGMTKIYGQGSSSITTTWDLTDLDLSPYKYIKVFIKGGDGNDSDSGMTSPIIVTIPLDSGIISGGATYYSGAGITAGINNHNRMWITFCAVDSTKTKFQLVRTISLYGAAGTDASDHGRFLYRIEGWYDIEGAETGGNTTVSTAAAVAELQQAFANYCPVIEDTRESEVATITGVAPFASLVDGQSIILNIKYRSLNNAKLKLTLSDGTLTNELAIYAQTNASVSPVMIAQLVAGAFYQLIYDDSNTRWVVVGKDLNETYHAITQAEIDAGTGTIPGSITPKILCDNFEKIPTLVEVSTTGDVTQSLESNKFYRFGEVDSLTLAFTAPQSGMGIYAGKFTASANWSALSLPVTIDEASGNDPILASKRYEFNLFDNIIVIKEV